MSKLETNTIDTVSGTWTLQVGSTNTSTITLGASGDTINIPSGATINNNGTQTGFGETNKYEFYAYQSSAQSISGGSYTTIVFHTEIFDTDCAFINSIYIYSPGEGGFYYFGFSLGLDSSSSFSVGIVVLIQITST